MGKLMQIISAMAGVIRTSSRGIRQDVMRYHARCRPGSPGRASNERQFHLSPDDCRRSDQAGKRGVVIWIEQAIHLGEAGLELFGHLFSGDVFLAHGFGQQGRCLVDRRGDSFVWFVVFPAHA